jgi:hypothetical protein
MLSAAPSALAMIYGALAFALPVTLLLSNPELETAPATA